MEKFIFQVFTLYYMYVFGTVAENTNNRVRWEDNKVTDSK